MLEFCRCWFTATAHHHKTIRWQTPKTCWIFHFTDTHYLRSIARDHTGRNVLATQCHIDIRRSRNMHSFAYFVHLVGHCHRFYSAGHHPQCVAMSSGNRSPSASISLLDLKRKDKPQMVHFMKSSSVKKYIDNKKKMINEIIFSIREAVRCLENMQKKI